MNLSKAFALIVGTVVTLVLVVYIPLQIIDRISAGTIDTLFGGIVIFLALVTGGIIGFFAVGLPILGIFEENSDEEHYEEKIKYLEERIRAYRARQRAMLEELDDIKKTLEEIRDILRKGLIE
ncbi:MAG: hypothetical protein DRJ35_05125 [Thermoprotei archaeon]|nr:MAG: hypothetical protein DRJ35_05125 [Thermoprotei archaeon]